MPNPRTPTTLLALNGGLSKNPGRYADRANEPASNGPIGDPPSGLNGKQRAIWREVIDLVPEGVLQKSDRLIVETVTRLVFELRTGESNMAAIAQLRMALASLGLTPADRSRVSAPKSSNESDPLEYLLN